MDVHPTKNVSIGSDPYPYLWLHESSSSPPPHAAGHAEEHPAPWRDPPPGRRRPLRTTRLPTPRPRKRPFDGHVQMENDDKYVIKPLELDGIDGFPEIFRTHVSALEGKETGHLCPINVFLTSNIGSGKFPHQFQEDQAVLRSDGYSLLRSWPTPNGEQRHIWENDQEQPLKTTFPPNGKNNNCLASYSMKKRESNLCPTLCQALLPSGPNRVGHKLLQ